MYAIPFNFSYDIPKCLAGAERGRIVDFSTSQKLKNKLSSYGKKTFRLWMKFWGELNWKINAVNCVLSTSSARHDEHCSVISYILFTNPFCFQLNISSPSKLSFSCNLPGHSTLSLSLSLTLSLSNNSARYIFSVHFKDVWRNSENLCVCVFVCMRFRAPSGNGFNGKSQFYSAIVSNYFLQTFLPPPQWNVVVVIWNFVLEGSIERWYSGIFYMWIPKSLPPCIEIIQKFLLQNTKSLDPKKRTVQSEHSIKFLLKLPSLFIKCIPKAIILVAGGG